MFPYSSKTPLWCLADNLSYCDNHLWKGNLLSQTLSTWLNIHFWASSRQRFHPPSYLAHILKLLKIKSSSSCLQRNMLLLLPLQNTMCTVAPQKHFTLKVFVILPSFFLFGEGMKCYNKIHKSTVFAPSHLPVLQYSSDLSQAALNSHKRIFIVVCFYTEIIYHLSFFPFRFWTFIRWLFFFFLKLFSKAWMTKGSILQNKENQLQKTQTDFSKSHVSKNQGLQGNNTTEFWLNITRLNKTNTKMSCHSRSLNPQTSFLHISPPFSSKKTHRRSDTKEPSGEHATVVAPRVAQTCLQDWEWSSGSKMW